MNDSTDQKPVLSVIVPIYGVEKYIERCARSLFEQTLENIEYIFVDDCTKDKSIDILKHVIDDYPDRKSQITILRHDVNKGLPQARKTGISVARGEFIAHCDSDDWIDTDMYRQMIEEAIEGNADVVVCDYFIHDGKKTIKSVQGCHDTTPEQFIECILLQKDYWALWNKVFRRKKYENNIIYPTCYMGEDMALCLQLIQYCDKIVYINKPFYYYFKNLESMSNKLSTETVLRNFYAVKDNTDIVMGVYSHKTKRVIKSGLIYIQYNAKAHLFPLVHRKEYRYLFLNTYPKLFRKMLFCFDIPFKCKAKYICALLGYYPRKID